MAKEYFCAYHSYLDIMTQLNDAEKGRLFVACLEYSRSGEVPQLSGNERFVFPAFKSQIDRDSAKYTERCDRNAQNGGKGGRPKNRTVSEETQNNRTVFSETQKSQGEGEGKGKGEREGKGKSNPPTPLEGVSPALSAAFADWLKYKAERREGYKPTGLKSLQTQVLSKAREYGDDAVAALIRECMAANYQGIIFDRLRGGRKDGNVDGHPGESVKYGTWL